MPHRFPPPTYVRPFLILSVSLYCQLTAGVLYWWPALAPGLKSAFSLTEPQTTALVATANSGSVLGVIGGVLHDHYGSRVTACLGAAGMSCCFFSLFAMTAYPLPAFIQRHIFWPCLFITISIVTMAYALYSASMTAAVSVFPKKYRGRVVGLCSAMYGASAAVFSAVQTAAFPTIAHTKGLLLFATLFALVPFILTALIFPDASHFDVDIITKSQTGYQALVEEQSVGNQGGVDELSVERGMSFVYAVCWALVLSLQSAAVTEVFGFPHFVQKACVGGIAFCMACFALLPLRVSMIVREKIGPGGEVAAPLPSFITVLMDPRYLYLCLGFFAVIGGGGITLLVQTHSLVSSRIYEVVTDETVWNSERVGGVVRTLVLIFATGSFTARLSVGGIADWGTTDVARLLWKYDILVFDVFVLMFSLLGVAFGQWVILYIAVAFIGWCHGTFFSVSPALTTLWFGVQSFPRNFALLGPFLALASASISSTLPSFFRARFGHWVEIPKAGTDGGFEHVCTGLACSVPTFGFLAVIQFVVFLLGWWLRPYVARKAEGLDF